MKYSENVKYLRKSTKVKIIEQALVKLSYLGRSGAMCASIQAGGLKYHYYIGYHDINRLFPELEKISKANRGRIDDRYWFDFTDLGYNKRVKVLNEMLNSYKTK
jgi:hypothetical protein